MPDEPLMLATLEYEGRELIHNDLISSAFHLKERIEKAREAGDMTGIGLDMMAAITMTAFAYEAYLNFVGFTAIKDFVEYQPGWKKRDQIMKQLGIDWQKDVRPFSTVDRLIKVRDTMAHGKPRLVKDEWEAIGTHSQLEEQIRNFRTGIESVVNYELLRDAYEDVEQVWRMMLQAAKIELFETLDGGMSGITFKGFVDPKA